MEREFQKKKLNKPAGGGSDISLDDIDTLQLEDGSTESLLAEIDYLLDACSKPIDRADKKKEEEIQKQKKSRSSGLCGCF